MVGVESSELEHGMRGNLPRPTTCVIGRNQCSRIISLGSSDETHVSHPVESAEICSNAIMIVDRVSTDLKVIVIRLVWNKTDQIKRYVKAGTQPL